MHMRSYHKDNIYKKSIHMRSLDQLWLLLRVLVSKITLVYITASSCVLFLWDSQLSKHIQ